MPIKAEREYRSIDLSNFTATRSEESDYIVEGYATTFDVPYDFGYDGAKECIARSALDNADMSDVIMLYDHQGMVLARQRNNSLSIMCDEHGLYVRANLGGTQRGRELHEAIRNGLVDRMSWAFIVGENGWEYDRETRTVTITNITKVFDVSAVSRPANEDTEIMARSYFDGVIEAEQQELLQRQRETDAKSRIAMRLELQGLSVK